MSGQLQQAEQKATTLKTAKTAVVDGLDATEQLDTKLEWKKVDSKAMLHNKEGQKAARDKEERRREGRGIQANASNLKAGSVQTTIKLTNALQQPKFAPRIIAPPRLPR